MNTTPLEFNWCAYAKSVVWRNVGEASCGVVCGVVCDAQ